MAASIGISDGGCNLRVASAHLAQSGRTFEEFKQSVHDLNNVINSRRSGFQLVIGIYVQEPLRPQHFDFFSDRVAPAFLGTRIFSRGGGVLFQGSSYNASFFVVNTIAPKTILIQTIFVHAIMIGNTDTRGATQMD